MKAPSTVRKRTGTTTINHNDEIAATLERLEAQAEVVHILSEDFDAATQAELDAKVMVLERALKAVAHLRPRICKPVACRRISWVGTTRAHSVMLFPLRGIELAGGAKRDGDYNDTRGAYKGYGLVLWEDGTLGELEYTGEWTEWMREQDHLECTAVPIKPRQALQQWTLEEVLAALSAALNEQAERVKPTEANRARARAAKLTAVATLPP